MKRLLIIWFILGICGGICAQDLKTLFVAMPDSLSPFLTEVNRADFGDFLESGMKAEVKNRFGNTSEMTKLTSDYLFLKSSSASTLELKLLPLNDSVKVICAVSTYFAPAGDSRIAFYDTNWKELPLSDFIQLPEEDEFYVKPQSDVQTDSLRNLRTYADMYLWTASLSADQPVLSITYSTPDYLDKKTADELKRYIVSTPLRYEWEDGKFVMQNKLNALSK
ncbi:DUF3256 family protein [Bacteroides mediterraneensis]|uniref:DUF3256 family protein n=1 Tax=Bacteroides mediterraneensis TaxID=1841856 RepID=UPI00195DB9AC|nr:DUF3256 family protein [Bacteroides mediterraneensis]MBM6781135.1 DUF3256 family protein [Bacteroides mediterraneensis]